MTTKTCTGCDKELASNSFPDERGFVCRACKQLRHQKIASSSYEQYLKSLYKANKHARSKRQNMVYEIKVQDLIDIWQKQQGRCAISGVFLTHHKDGSGSKDFNASIDRISNHQGYVRLNVQLVALRVNYIKHTLEEDMFYWWVKTIHDFSCD